MGQVSAYLRRTTRGYAHWCPGCAELHVIFNSWQFNGNVQCPTFIPSVKITSKQRIIKAGIWQGGWQRDAAGKAIDYCCHYNLTNGILLFHGDCTHNLAGQSIPLPELPVGFRDNLIDEGNAP